MSANAKTPTLIVSTITAAVWAGRNENGRKKMVARNIYKHPELQQGYAFADALIATFGETPRRNASPAREYGVKSSAQRYAPPERNRSQSNRPAATPAPSAIAILIPWRGAFT